MKKLTCHCAAVELEVKLPESGFEKLLRCNCSLCKRKGYIMTMVGPDDVKIVKGKDILKLYFDGIDKYQQQLVSWNGKGFDSPVIHYRALYHKVSSIKYWDKGDDDKNFKWNN